MGATNFLFDLDGTLVDTMSGIVHSMQAAVDLVLPGTALPGPAQLRTLIGPPLRKVLQTAFSVSSDETLDVLEKAFRFNYDTEGSQLSTAYPGVASALARLRENGAPCFVVTNKRIRPSLAILERLELRSFFTEVVSPDIRTPRFASKTEVLADVAARHGLQAAESFFVGDSEDDARAARDCGMTFLAVAYGYGAAPTQNNARAILTRFPEVLEFLPKQNQGSIGQKPGREQAC